MQICVRNIDREIITAKDLSFFIMTFRWVVKPNYIDVITNLLNKYFMAKITLNFKANEINNIIASQEFNTLRTTTQVGDRFYVPAEGSLLVLGTKVDGRDIAVGQHFPAIRIIDGTPVEVVELYVGQLVKLDVNRKLVFNTPLSDALRKNGEAFKEAVCDRILEVTDSQEIDDRDWDDKANAYKRDENNKYIPTKKTAYKFEAKRHNLSDDMLTKAYEMLKAYINENYGEIINAE